MGYKPAGRKCAREKCNKTFKRKARGQIYCSKECRNKAAQERLRERARMFTNLQEKEVVNG
jgi:hypothetical protein